jgi:hypothetical protein
MADPIGQPNIDPTGQKKSPADYIDTNKIAQALNVNMEGVPGAPDISEIKKRVTTPQAAISELGTLEDQQQRLRQSIGQFESGRDRALKIGESGVAQYASDTANQIRAGQERIKSENPYPKFIPTQENVQSLSTLFSLLGVIAVGGGSKNKLSAMGAINSMTGMLKGWREGRADLWKREQAQFEKDMANVKANLDSAARDADLALKMLPYDVRKAETMMQELVAKTGSQILTQKANLQGIQETVKYIKELQAGFKEQFEQNLKTSQEARLGRAETRGVETLEETKRHNKKVESHQSRMENKADYQYFVTNDNQVLYINKKNPKDTGIVKDMEGNVRKLGAAPATEKLPKKGETAAKFVGEVIGRKVDVAAAEKLTGTVDYVSKLDNLAKKSVSLGNVAGLSVNLADKVNSLLKASVPVDASGQQIITQEALDTAWQKAQESRDFTALSDKSKVMAKAELDTIMSYLQSKYGNRAPVAEFRAAQNVISRRSASPTAFNQVMKEEKESAYKRLIGAGFNADDIAKVNKRFKEEEGRMRSLDSPSSASNAPEGVDPDTWSHMTDAERALWQQN